MCAAPPAVRMAFGRAGEHCLMSEEFSFSEQLNFFAPLPGGTCALTGHRVLAADFSFERLRVALRALAEGGTRTFLCGMALGFDIACAEEVLALRPQLDVRLVACIPCADQSAHYPRARREQYERILAACDERVVLHEHYCDGCMFERNRYMVDRCDRLLAYLTGTRGGTYYTVRYAQKKGKPVLFL